MTDFEKALDSKKEYGIIEEIIYPVCLCTGLPNAHINEMVIFEDGSLGRVLALRKEQVEVLVFADTKISVGSKVALGEDFLSIPVGFELLGQVIDPLGNLIFKNSQYTQPKMRSEVDILPESIAKRARIKKQLSTGITLIDQLIPLGMGQRELIVGDRKTGKTGTVFSIIKNQASLGTIVIYAAIGKRTIEIKKLKQDFENAGILNNVCLIASSSDTSPSLIDLTPYSAMCLANFFKSKQKDTLVIFDDLSTHAKFYREIALISKKFPGRDSYPGDIFYKHAKLLECAGNFIVENKDISITALPIAETIEGELTDYITSNLISITDGHILFDQKSFNKGIRPAVNIFLSVTRVGKQTQDTLGRDLTRNLLTFLGKYERTQEFSHFGSELSVSSKQLLAVGEKMYKLFEQDIDDIIHIEVQRFMIGVLWKEILPDLKSFQVSLIRKKVAEDFTNSPDAKKLILDVIDCDTLDSLLENVEKNKLEIQKICKI